MVLNGGEGIKREEASQIAGINGLEFARPVALLSLMPKERLPRKIMLTAGCQQPDPQAGLGLKERSWTAA